MTKILKYKGNEDHYKSLINKINDEVNFSGYLVTEGYKLKKKSASYLEFESDKDKIVLKTSVRPNTYFNRNDSQDNGLFFNFLSKRSKNFYTNIKVGLEIINRAYEMSTLEIIKPRNTSNKSLEENYNITEELIQNRYLVKDRLISEKILNSNLFKGRILNAYHINQNKSSIPNIAFPMYDSNNTIKNYRLYNKEYYSKNSGKMEKFRIVLNSKNANYLFYSNPNIPKIKTFYIGENEIDALSYFELKKDNEALYLSLGGALSKEKKENLLSIYSNISKEHKNINLVSITDNDAAGLHFDLELSAYLISNQNNNNYVEYKKNNPGFDFIINYHSNTNEISKDFNDLKINLNPTIIKLKESHLDMKLILFKDKIKWTINNNKKLSLNNDLKKNIIEALSIINKKYNPISFKIHKSETKDWNEDLKKKKDKNKQLKM